MFAGIILIVTGFYYSFWYLCEEVTLNFDFPVQWMSSPYSTGNPNQTFARN